MTDTWYGTGHTEWNAHRGHGGAPGHTHPAEPGRVRHPGNRHPENRPEPETRDDSDIGRHGRRELEVQVDLLDENREQASAIRRRLEEAGIFAVNLMSSPGAGKTALLESTLPRLDDLRIGVIEGDIETRADADRLSPFDVAVSQINTGPFGGDCHLAAPLVGRALDDLPLDDLDLLFVENVGNLVCPAEFDIGEDRKVVLISLTEGEDKPLKYPLMFRRSDLAVVTKVDLLPHLNVDAGLVERNIHAVHPDMPILRLSNTSGEGVDAWLEWLRTQAAAARRASV